MITRILEVRSDTQFNNDLTTWNGAMNSLKVLLALKPEELVEIGKLTSDFTSALTAANTAKAAAKSAVTSKDVAKKAALTLVRKYSKKYRADLSISDSVLDQLLFAPHATPGSSTPPSVPTGLIAEDKGLSVVGLAWHANGNKYPTTYVIETRSSATDAWTILDTTTKRRFDYQADGNPIWFRITAKRSGLTSTPSTAVSLWVNGQGVNLKVAA
ncbi:MAG: hypothetical protein K8R88_06980 [Armatimonadetes bacterium]|nr:hypothetical protein [Armatimonadota bacterium]